MEDEIPDVISSLPYEILQHIVSFIPLKEAVRTSLLSTRWRNISTPFLVNLKFYSDEITSDEAGEELKQIIGNFLRTYESPQLLKFFVKAAVSDSKSIGNSHESLKLEDELFLIATKGVHRELHLNFFEQKKAMTSHFSLLLQPKESIDTTTFSFSSLETLHLRSVTHMSETFVSTLFSHCRLLETLNLEKCSHLQNINFKANEFFQKFIVMDCSDIVSISISAPSLKSFSYRGVLPTIQLKNTANLVDVILNLRDGLGQNEFDCEDVISLLASLKDIEILTISGWLLEWLCTAGVIFGQLEFKLSKLKELWWVDSSINISKRDSLACFLNMTTFLEKLFIKIDKTCRAMPCPLFHEYWHEPHLWMDYATVKSNSSQLQHLKTVNLDGFTKEEDELLLMDLILHKAIALKTMTVKSRVNQSWCVSKVPQSQLKRISSSFHPKCVVVSSSNIQCFFVLTEVVDNNSLRVENGRCV